MRGLAAALVVIGMLAAAGSAHASTAVGLGMREWSIAVYRPTVTAGTVRFLVTNRGEDAHTSASAARTATAARSARTPLPEAGASPCAPT